MTTAITSADQGRKSALKMCIRDSLYTYTYNDASFTLDTREMREILGEIPLNTPEVSAYIMEYLKENQQETDGGALI